MNQNFRPQLEVRDLQLVLALAEAQSTAGAAQSLHVTQSAVSRALAQAEERLGLALFERSARGVLPTLAGSRLIAAAPRLLGELRELERCLAAPVVPPRSVRLVCECYTAYRWLPSALAHLRELMPDLELSIAYDHTRDPMQGLLRSQVDIALLTTARLPQGDARRTLAELPLFSDEVVFLISARHRLAHQKAISARDLCEERLITSHAPPAEATWFLREVFGRRKPKLELLRFPLTEAIVDAARAGLGIAVLSEWMASGYASDRELVIKRLANRPLRRPWRIAYQRSATEVAERLIGALSASAPKLGAVPRI
ncbi:MAG TPA: LysR family transcriptional regulator [Polyangiaceae bacterium]|nr:LysR family transcriptional regulator [Polyangiaceae bacterium]